MLELEHVTIAQVRVDGQQVDLDQAIKLRRATLHKVYAEVVQ